MYRRGTSSSSTIDVWWKKGCWINFLRDEYELSEFRRIYIDDDNDDYDDEDDSYYNGGGGNVVIITDKVSFHR
jgi:hypothetical protein